MSDDTSDAIARLRTSTQLLNSAADSAAATMRDAEQFLESCAINAYFEVRARYGVYSSGADEPDWEEYLCYFEHGNRFRIGVLRRDLNGEDAGEIKPWVECSREVKLANFHVLPELLQGLSQFVENRANKAVRTVDDVNSLVRLPKKKKGA